MTTKGAGLTLGTDDMFFHITATCPNHCSFKIYAASKPREVDKGLPMKVNHTLAAARRGAAASRHRLADHNKGFSPTCLQPAFS